MRNPLTADIVVYIDTAANEKLTFGDIGATAEQFGQGLSANWGWCKGGIIA